MPIGGRWEYGKTYVVQYSKIEVHFQWCDQEVKTDVFLAYDKQ